MQMANIELPIKLDLPENCDDQVVEAMKKDPNADWVDVVRCRKCRWFVEFCDKYKAASNNDGMCDHPKFGRYLFETVFNYYCADGEREDAGDEPIK